MKKCVCVGETLQKEKSKLKDGAVIVLLFFLTVIYFI